MNEAEKIVAKVKELVSEVDMHRNREKREVLDAIRELVGVVEKAPEPAPVVEPEPVAEVAAEPVADDLGDKDASNQSGGSLEQPVVQIEGSDTRRHIAADGTLTESAPAEVVKRGPGRPRKQPAIAED